MTASNVEKFADIRPIRDHEIVDVVSRIIANPYFRKIVAPYIQPETWNNFSSKMLSCKTVKEFQDRISFPILTRLFEKTHTNITSANWNNIPKDKNYVFISNHRDIVLDAAILNYLMMSDNRNTVEIAIGDNLLIVPWVSDLARINKSFIVKRSISLKQLLIESKKLSEYICDTIVNRQQSVWIAQREGRAKDSNDRTQSSVLKMLSLYNKSNPLAAFKELNIVPLSLSYEYDPCDFLKAKEFQMKRDDTGFKKTFFDDLENMRTGIVGYKGRVHIQFGIPIANSLDLLHHDTDKGKLISQVASLIDKEIHRNYFFFKHNYVAYDLMMNTNRFESEYTRQDRDKFEAYISKQIDKVDLENKDDDFLREKIVEMYGNIVRNYLSAIGEE